MTTGETAKILINNLFDMINRELDRGATLELDLTRGFDNQTQPGDVCEHYEPNGTYTLVIKLDGGAVDR